MRALAVPDRLTSDAVSDVVAMIDLEDLQRLPLDTGATIHTRRSLIPIAVAASLIVTACLVTRFVNAAPLKRQLRAHRSNPTRPSGPSVSPPSACRKWLGWTTPAPEPPGEIPQLIHPMRPESGK